jgi:Sds3-like
MSPPANPPLSKRDKRRSALQDRLQELTATFSQNRDTQFRQQLHALQCDMTLINNADPYAPGPLPDSADDIAQLIETTVGGGKFGKEMAGLAGTWYSRFVQEINQVKEDKDAELVMLMVGSRFKGSH